jgi:hypothetical protein
MEKLNKLKELCKISVCININNHKQDCISVERYFKDGIMDDYLEEIAPEVFEKMKELNTIIDIQYYPRNIVGFYRVFHYDLEKAIDEALASLENN